MNSKFQKLIEAGVPFLVLGIACAFLFALLIFFSYILLWGILLGAILGLGSWIRRQFTKQPKARQSTAKSKGRVIEHEDNH